MTRIQCNQLDLVLHCGIDEILFQIFQQNMDDTMVMHLIKPSKICVALLFVSCSLITFQNAADAQESFPPTVRRERGTAWEVNGLVRSPAGLPVPGAKYHLESGTYYRPMWRSRSRLIEEGQVDAFGKFIVSVHPINFVVASARGFAPTAVGVPEGSLIEIELDPGRSVSGLVKLPNGTPAEDVEVRPVGFLYPLKKHELSEFPASEIAIHPQLRYRSLGFPESGEPWAVKTDEDGRFTIDRIPTNRRVAIAVEKLGYRTQVVWVKTLDDSNENFYPEFKLKSDGFEIGLQPCFVLKLSGRNEATGKFEKISRIMVPSSHVKPQDVSPSNPNVYVVDFPAAVDVETSLQSMSNGVDIWVEPEDDALMGFRFHVDSIGTEGELEKTILFRPGKLLKGKVASVVDGEPIPGVHLEWTGADRNNWALDSDFPKFNVQTEEDGSYAIAVPDSDGSLAVIGGVDGFRSVDSWKWIHDPLFADSAKRLSRVIKKGALDARTTIDFQLEPSSEVRFLVLRPNGQPEPNAIISAKVGDANSTAFPRIPNRRETLTTDVDGKAMLDNWYNQAGLLAWTQKFFAAPDAQQNPRLIEGMASAGYPTIVEAFSNSGMLQGSAVIPPPEIGSSDPIEVEIKLMESAAILGKVVDQDGQPMNDLKVTLTLGTNAYGYGSQTWETKTRVDGYFKATGLLPGNDYLIMLGDNDVKPLGARFDRLPLDVKDQLFPGKTTEIATIECFDCRFLGGNLPELSIDGLEQSEAFEVIATYVQQQMSKVPEENPRFPSRSTRDPIPVFLEKLAAVLLPKLKEAGNLNPGSEVELEQLTVINSFFLPPSISLNFSGESRVRYFVTERLLDQFNQHPNAQPSLLATADTMGRWKQLFARSNYIPTKQVAGVEAALELAREVGNKARMRSSADQFEASFQALESHLIEMINLPKFKTNAEVNALQSRVDEIRKVFESRYEFNENNDVPESYRYNADRLQRLFDRMDLFVDQVRK